jgi:hypothetical protein
VRLHIRWRGTHHQRGLIQMHGALEGAEQMARDRRGSHGSNDPGSDRGGSGVPDVEGNVNAGRDNTSGPAADLGGGDRGRGGDLARRDIPGSNVAFHLRRETEAARTLVASLADVLGDDTDLAADTIEGETNLQEVILSAIARIVELDTMTEGIKATQDALAGRKARLEKQREMIRESLAVAFEVACIKKLETPLATISLRAVPPRVEVIDESAIPAAYWKPQEPRLDRKAVLDALKDKQDVPGATLSNGGMAVSIRMA